MRIFYLRLVILILTFQIVYSDSTQSKNITSIILNKNHTIKIIKGDSIEIECPIDNSIISNNKKYEIKWFKNRKKVIRLNPHSKINNEIILNDNKLVITRLSKTNLWSYHCEIITGTGQNIKSSFLFLEPPNDNANNQSSEKSNKNELRTTKGKAPEFLDQHENDQQIYKFEQSKLEFDCRAIGFPDPQILWYKNGKIISEEELGLTRNSMFLTLDKIVLRDSALYRCRVSNEFGEINRTFNLQVIENDKVNQNVKLNDVILINCPLSNIPFQTRKNAKWFAKLNNLDEFTNQDQLEIDGDVYSALNLTKINYPSAQSDLFLNTDFSTQLFNNLFKNNKNRLNMYQLVDGSILINQALFAHNGDYLCSNDNQISSKRVHLDVIQFMDSIKSASDFDIDSNEFIKIIKDNFSKLPIIVISFLCILSFILIITLTCYYMIKLKKSTKIDQKTYIKDTQNLIKTISQNNQVQNLHLQHQTKIQPDYFRSRRFSYTTEILPSTSQAHNTNAVVFKSLTNPRSIFPMLYQHQQQHHQQQQQQQQQQPFVYTTSDNQVIYLQQNHPHYQTPNHQSTKLNLSVAKSCSSKSCSKYSK